MKAINAIKHLALAAVALCTVSLASCGDDSDPIIPVDTPVLSVAPQTIKNDGQEQAIFAVLVNGVDVTAASKIYNAEGQELPEAKFSSTVHGEYTFTAKFNDKTSNTVKVTVKNVVPDKTYLLESMAYSSLYNDNEMNYITFTYDENGVLTESVAYTQDKTTNDYNTNYSAIARKMIFDRSTEGEIKVTIYQPDSTDPTAIAWQDNHSEIRLLTLNNEGRIKRINSFFGFVVDLTWANGKVVKTEIINNPGMGMDQEFSYDAAGNYAGVSHKEAGVDSYTDITTAFDLTKKNFYSMVPVEFIAAQENSVIDDLFMLGRTFSTNVMTSLNHTYTSENKDASDNLTMRHLSINDYTYTYEMEGTLVKSIKTVYEYTSKSIDYTVTPEVETVANNYTKESEMTLGYKTIESSPETGR